MGVLAARHRRQETLGRSHHGSRRDASVEVALAEATRAQQRDHIERAEVAPTRYLARRVNRAEKRGASALMTKPSRASRQSRVTHLQYSNATIA